MRVAVLLLTALAGARPPVPIDPGTWIGPSDYPVASLRAGAAGTVAVRLTVDNAGAVQGCTVTAGSGQADLDEATCRLIRLRGHFTPAVDGARHATAASYATSIRWQLPPPPPTPVMIVTPPGSVFTRPLLTKPVARPVTRRVALADPIAVPPPPPIEDPKALAPPADPRVVFGTLPNGLRYAILSNNLPHRAMSYRLQIGSGSLDETDAQRGYAHLIEHMSFRGSTNIKDGDFERSLEALGLNFGNDTAANTDFEHTTWSLDFPVVYRSTMGTGLDLLREVADRVAFQPAALDVERHVVESEERLRDNPALEAERARIGLLFAGQRVTTRWTIGTTASIEGATAPALRAFYAKHYRPDNAVLVAVGAVNPVEVEAEIKATFGDWQRPTEPLVVVDHGEVAKRGETVRLFTTPGAPEQVELNWVSPYDGAPDTYAHERGELAELLASAVLDHRLGRMTEALDAPFEAAGAHREAMFHSGEVVSVTLAPSAGDPGRALSAAVLEERRLVRFGVTAAEVDEEVKHLRTAFAEQAAGAQSRSNADLARGLLASFDSGDVFTTPAQRAADFERLVKGLSTDDVNAGVKRLFAGAGPLVFVSGPKPPTGGELALRHAVDQGELAALTPEPTEAVGAWAYTDFGTPGQVAERKTYPDLGVTVARFANGTSVAIKPFPRSGGNVSVDLTFGGGLAGLSPEFARSFWMLSSGSDLFVNGGLGKATVSELRRQMADRAVDIRFGVDEERFHLIGHGTAGDLDRQLQLLAAFVSDPGFRQAPIAHARAILADALPQFGASPSATAGRDLPSLLHAGDPRWRAVPDAATLATSEPEDFARMLRPALAGPLNLVVVGDVDVDRVIAAAAATIGALPPRAPRPPVAEAHFPAPVATPVVDLHHGRPDQAIAVLAWPTNGFYANMHEARAVQVAAEIIRARLIDGLRETQGLTYAPGVEVDQSLVLPHYGSLAVEVEVTPAHAPDFFAEAGRIAADLARRPVSDDELTRATAPLLDQSRVALYTADYWLHELGRVDEDGRALDIVRTRAPDLETVTAADIQHVASTYLSPASAWQLLIRAPIEAAAPAGHPPVPR